MNVEYCIKCGGKAEFSVSKPKFCPACGSAFNRFERQDQKLTKRASLEEVYDDEDDDDDDEYHEDEFSNLNIERLKRRVVVKAEVESNARKTIGDLSPPSSGLNLGPREPRQGEESLNSSDIVRKIQQECRQIKSSEN